MNIPNTTKRFVRLFALAALVPLAAGADGVLHGRVSFDAGGTLVKGSQESDWSSATVNTLVLTGDTLWVDNGGTTEVEFSGGTFLRMADGSKAEVLDVPPNATLRGWIGSFYVQRLSRSAGAMVFYTPAAIIEIDNDASVRIDIVSEGVTTVSTRWGRATIRTEAGGQVEAHAGRRVFVEAGLLPSEPTPFDRTEEDAFDQWNRERAEFLATGGSTTPASVPISSDVIGVSDLDRYGEWVYVDNTPCWRPTVVVDYTPYHNGYWNYVGNVGNVWVGNYPFCYVTSHYGYWDYHRTYGWVWSYRPQWSPAWCATVQYGDYFVWAPVNRYYRPVYPSTSAYFSVGGVSFGYLGTSYCHVDSLYMGPSYVYYTNNDPFRRYCDTPDITINIWNINSDGRRPHVRVPYNDSVTTVRDYTPRRQIRGAETLLASGRSAGERARNLESVSGRESFSRTQRTGGEFSRTDVARIDAGSRTRNVRIDQQAPDYARASRSKPIVASNSRERGSREGEAVTVSNTRDRQSGTRTQAAEPRNSESPRTSATGRSTERGTGRGTTGENTGESTVERSRTARTDIDPGFGSTPIRTQRTAPTRTRVPESGQTVTPDRSSDTPATRTRTPQVDTGSTTRSTRSSVDSERTPARTTAPRIDTAPSRTATPRSSEGFVDRNPSVRTATPTTRTQPRESYTPPTRTVSPERSEPSVSPNRQPRYSEPVRSQEPRVQAPSYDRSTPINRAPVTSRDEIQPRAIPQEAPRAPERSYQAPSRSNDSAPSYQSPRVDSSRSESSGRSSGGRESGGRDSGGRGR